LGRVYLKYIKGGEIMIFDLFGWIGMVLVLVAYALLSTKKIDMGKTYQVINLLAAIFMAIGLFPKNAWFSFALQVAWGIIAIFAIVKIIMQEKKEKQS
jgi:uncharacterized membrane protein